jgi:carbonic anhydrase/acetyltransferase-like protein (isoleucine patch superfamily)
MPLYALGDWKPELPEDGRYWIAPNATLIGRVRLARDASIWFGTVLRADYDWIEIGEGSNIQDNCVIHTDPGQPTVVGARVTVGHNVILHSTHIGDGSLIGMGSIVLNNSRIGRNCLIGAGTLITEGKVIPDNSMVVGSPGRVIRDVSDAQRAGLAASAEGYIQNHRRFRDGMTEIAPLQG